MATPDSWRSVREIVDDDTISRERAALECLANASDYADLPRQREYLEAARTLAELAVAEATTKLARETTLLNIEMRRATHLR